MAVVEAGAGMGGGALLVPGSLEGLDAGVVVAVAPPRSLVAVELTVGISVPGVAVPPVETEQAGTAVLASITANRATPTRTRFRMPHPRARSIRRHVRTIVPAMSVPPTSPASVLILAVFGATLTGKGQLAPDDGYGRRSSVRDWVRGRGAIAARERSARV